MARMSTGHGVGAIRATSRLGQRNLNLMVLIWTWGGQTLTGCSEAQGGSFGVVCAHVCRWRLSGQEPREQGKQRASCPVEMQVQV